jgi:hypothetical protein
MSTLERPTTPVRQADMARDERIEAHVYWSLGWSHKQIADRMGKTVRQVQRACLSPPTPKKRSGRPATITIAMRQELVAFVSASARNRLLP